MLEVTVKSDKSFTKNCHKLKKKSVLDCLGIYGLVLLATCI